MGQKVIYVDQNGNRFDAEITGPVATIHKPKLKRTGKGEHDLQIVQPGETIMKVGQQSVMGATKEHNRVRPYVNLTVNFGDEAHPRYGDVSGVRREGDNDNRYRKAYYIPVDEVVVSGEAPKIEVKSEPAAAAVAPAPAPAPKAPKTLKAPKAPKTPKAE